MKKKEVAGRIRLGLVGLVVALVALLSLLLWLSSTRPARQAVSPESDAAPVRSEPEVVVESIRQDAAASLAEEELPEGPVEEHRGQGPVGWVLDGSAP